MLLKKNDSIELTITDIGVNGEGYGRYEGCSFFVKNAVPGDRVRAVITRMNKGYGYAKVLEVLEASAQRVKPACPNAERCGGCQIMQLSYDEQLRIKEEKVRSCLTHIGKQTGFELCPIIGMADPYHYRNKTQFPVGLSRDGRIVTGFYAGHTHYIVETDECCASQPAANVILRHVRDFLNKNELPVYDEETGTGLVRHVLIRTARGTGECMVCLVINGSGLPYNLNDEFVRALTKAELPGHARITSICLNINKEKTNVILGRKVICLYGNEYITDTIGDLSFRISPLAFFQINPEQTEKLYAKALEYAGLTGRENVWDLFCGSGTISLFLARQAALVRGVEIVPAAIENAEENARLNGIENALFFCGEAEKIFPEWAQEEDAQADVVVVDPPRKGCDARLLEAILKVAPDRIVYVSCDPATLARDVKILSDGGYKLVKAQPVDMFPHTVHVETVVLMTKKKKEK